MAAAVCFTAGGLSAWGVARFMRTEHPAAPVSGPREPVALEAPMVDSPSTLWVLAAGVSRYAETALNLRFADRDAEAIAGAFEAQRGLGLYGNVRTQVFTNEAVTRERILTELESLLTQVRPDDVVVVFLAGHGVQDALTGSYYFLPAPANAQNLRTQGLRMTDVDELLRVLRAEVRGVIVMLDTCHAAAPRTRTPAAIVGKELIAPISGGNGFYIFAATRSDEQSIERDDLGHGSFTYALIEGLGGAADGDRDGVVPISDLFGYVARRVPQLSQSAQHPYHRIEGADLMLAKVRNARVATVSDRSSAASTIAVGRFRSLRDAPEHDWIGPALRVAFNTELSKVPQLRVYVPQIVDRTPSQERADEVRMAHEIGIGRLITGTYQVLGARLRIDAQIVDTAAATQQASDSIEGALDDFFALQKQLVLRLLTHLPAQPSDGGTQANTTGNSVDAYRMFLESEGVIAPPAAVPPAGPGTSGESTPPVNDLPTPLSRLPAWLVSAAYAEEPTADLLSGARQTLEDFRAALQGKDLERLEKLYVHFPAAHRSVLAAYLHQADELRVEFTDIRFELRPAGLLATYTRIDQFIDHETSRPVRLEARLARLLVRENQTWKLGDAQ